MRIYFRFITPIVLVIWFVGVVTATAQTQSPTDVHTASHSPEDEKEWVKIRALKDLYIEAAKVGEVGSLAPFLSKNFTGTMLTGEEIKGFNGLKEYNRKMQELVGPGATHEMKVTYLPGFMRGDLAIAHGTTDEVVVTSLKNRFHFHSQWTGVLIREDGDWKVFRLHVSMNPTENEFVNHYCSKIVRKYAGIGLLIGLLIGALVGCWWGRRARR